MQRFTMLSKSEMKAVLGGVGAHTDASCSASCNSSVLGSYSITCYGTDCYAHDGDGCFGIDRQGDPDMQTCAD